MTTKQMEMVKSAAIRCASYAPSSRTENEEAIVLLSARLVAVEKERDYYRDLAQRRSR